MPFSGGPSLIFAPSPASWQGKHHLRNAASCCASALPAEATTSNEANIQVFILDLLSILPTPPFFASASVTLIGNPPGRRAPDRSSNGVWRGTCQRPAEEFAAPPTQFYRGNALAAITSSVQPRADGTRFAPMEMPHGGHAGARSGGARAPRPDRQGALRDRARRGGDRERSRDAALRDRRAHRLSLPADGGRAAVDHRAGQPHPRLLPWRRYQGGTAGGRYLTIGRRAAFGRRRSPRHGQVQ